MVYKFDKEKCEICTKIGADFCVIKGDARITEFHSWNGEDWEEEEDLTTVGARYYYFCRACFDGVEDEIRRGKYFDEDF